MPLIPLKQSITITKPGEDDGWGGTTPGEEVELSARVTETHEVVTNQHGDEMTSTARIYVDGLADVTYADTVLYADELGRTIDKEPISIAPVRGIAGASLLTKIHL
ncbi:hypothetical protein D7Z54_33055 [Salibacterium salarium]|uniref:Uncharacterized protein n=1 Tax=Salibacterium salarium TaxID=284579 RepID=A0A428MSK1_9BACI|nr:hypothetical protein [Salibacterium salarium]RSL29094.1 hypothetical protein D7Z54_33055 [Salibacterium salarium]